MDGKASKHGEGFDDSFEVEEGAGSRERTEFSIDECSALPHGSVDPVYEAKARVLNDAVISHLGLWCNL